MSPGPTPAHSSAPLALGSIALYTVAIFLGASLLFLVQPLIAKILLPLLGGSPAVWTTAMVFFQALLLGGYLYAHLIARLPLRRQLAVHGSLLLLAASTIPIGLPEGWSPVAEGSSPTLWTLGALAASVGIPFFALSSGGPLLQSWFAQTGTRFAKDPYFLYAASNAGSMLALLAYPFLVEPSMRLSSQRIGWSWGYAVFAVTVMAAGLVMLRRKADTGGEVAVEEVSSTPGIPWNQRMRWVFLAFVPSSALLGVTQHLSSEVAVFPLLSVLPLAVYLLSFIIVFSRGGTSVVAVARNLLPLVAVAVAVLIAAALRRPFAALVTAHVLGLLVIGLVCHGRLAADRPPARRLTDFYLMLAVGGVLGGLFNSILAPALFDWIAEYPLLVAVACLAWPPNPTGRDPATIGTSRHWLGRLYPFAILTLLVAILLHAPGWIDDCGIEHGDWPRGLFEVFRQVPGAVVILALLRFRMAFALGILLLVLVPRLASEAQRNLLHSERTFFGVHRVVAVMGGPTVWHKLLHGSTRHGIQCAEPPLSTEPTSYYTRSGPAGELLGLLARDTRRRTIAVVGLGAGTLAAYGRPEWRMHFYEIDPEVVRIALDPTLFTYLADSRSPTEMILGDARLTMARAPEATYDAIVLDAFSSDAVPAHLLTREAFAGYLEKLRPGGFLAVHISNWNLDLEPVLAAAAADLDLVARLRYDGAQTEEDEHLFKSGSTWVVLARSGRALGAINHHGDWRELRPRAGVTAWTDDYSSILSVFRW